MFLWIVNTSRLAVAALGFATVVNTVAISGAATATFEVPEPDTSFPPGSVTSGTGTADFEWGSINPDSGQDTSFFSYSSASFNGSTGFSVGSFEYFNGSSAENTGVRFVDLDLLLSLSDVTPAQHFRFTLEIVNTDNFGALQDQGNADIVRFTQPTATTLLHTAAADLYLTLSFQLDVDQADGFLSENDNALNVIESGGATARLIANLSATPPSASLPDAGFTISLLGLAVASLSFLRRYRP